jgi:hypothetical protein
MPKKDVDYSNTIIYKIYCKDDAIKDLYVGHTTNFVQRKYAHKVSSNNPKSTLKIYNTIRSNGGWDNWDMVEIAKYCCKNSTEARIKEQHHYEELNASLNCCPPYVDIKKYYCNICELQCSGPKQYNVHINGNKHAVNFKNQQVDKNEQNSLKNTGIYFCKCCKYDTSSKKDYKKHILTEKHSRLANAIKMLADSTILSPQQNQTFVCNCGKSYVHDSSYYRHKKKCTYIADNISTNVVQEQNISINKDELILMILKQNSEILKENSELRKEQTDIKELLLEIVKKWNS